MERVAKLLVALVFLTTLLPVASLAYDVAPGDTLWGISAKCWNDAPGWRTRLLEKNPHLKEPARIVERGPGDVLVRLTLDEKLVGVEGCLDGSGYVTVEDFIKMMAPPRELQGAIPGAQEVVKAELTNSSQGHQEEDKRLLVLAALWLQERAYSLIWLFIWALAIAALFVAALVGYIGWRHRGSLAPMVPGGIPADEPAAVEARFTQIAQRHLLAADPTAYLTLDNIVRVGPIEIGLANGKGDVEYRGGRPLRERFRNELMYRATYRFPDAHEEALLFKQICGNDVRIGTRYTGFRFMPISVVASAPTPAAPAPIVAPAPALTPAPAATPVVATAPVSNNGTAPVASATTPVSIGGLVIMMPAGSSIEVGQDGRIVVVPAAVRSVQVDPVLVLPS